MESGWTGDNDPRKVFAPTPRFRRKLVEYLRNNPALDASKQDDWRKRCSESFQATSYALYVLAKDNQWLACPQFERHIDKVF
jgi:hypothetical protein